MREIRSWPKKWEDAARRGIAWRFERPRSARWPLVGMLALGLVAGATLGGLAVSQRWRLKRLSDYGRRMRVLPAEPDMHEGATAATVLTVPRSNDRQKTSTEV